MKRHFLLLFSLLGSAVFAAEQNRIVPHLREQHQLVIPAPVGTLDNFFCNWKNGLAEHLGALKKVQAGVKINQYAQIVQDIEDIRLNAIQMEMQARRRLLEIDDIIEGTMLQIHESIATDATHQRATIEQNRIDYTQECERINTILTAPHQSAQCHNCDELSIMAQSHQLLLEDDELMEATLDAFDTFKNLACKSLEVQQKTGRNRVVPFTDLISQHNQQINRYNNYNLPVNEDQTVRVQKSRRGRDILDTIETNLPTIEKRDVGSDVFALILRIRTEIALVSDDFAYLEEIKKTTERRLENELSTTSIPFLQSDTVVRTEIDAEWANELTAAATRIGVAATTAAAAAAAAATAATGGVAAAATAGVASVRPIIGAVGGACFKELTVTSKLNKQRLAQVSNIAAEDCRQANENFTNARRSTEKALEKLERIRYLVDQIKRIQLSANQVHILHQSATQANDRVLEEMRRVQQEMRTLYRNVVENFKKVEESEECLGELRRKIETNRQSLEQRIRQRAQMLETVPRSESLRDMEKRHVASMDRLKNILIDRLRTVNSSELSRILGDTKIRESLQAWLMIHDTLAQEYLTTLTGSLLVKSAIRQYVSQYIMVPIVILLFISKFA